MICFKDMTFCGSDCVNTDCHRLFTPELNKQAIDWADGWSTGRPPIAWSDFSDTCDVYKKEVE